MTFEQMVMILAGRSDKVIKEVEKQLKPLVSGIRVNRQK